MRRPTTTCCISLVAGAGVSGFSADLELVVTPAYLESAISREVTAQGWSPRSAMFHVGLNAQVPGRTVAFLTYALLEAVDTDGHDLIDDYTRQTAEGYSGYSSMSLGPPQDLVSTASPDLPLIMFSLHPTDADTSIARVRLDVTTHLTDGTRTTLRVGPLPTGLDQRYAVPGTPCFTRLPQGGVRLTYASAAHKFYKNFWFEIDGKPHQGYNGGGGPSNEDPKQAYYDVTDQVPDGAELCLDLITLTGTATTEVTIGPWSLADRGLKTAFAPLHVPVQLVTDAP